MKSVLCYSRESFTTLYSKVLCMFRLIRTGEHCSDMSAIERVVQLADNVGEDWAVVDKGEVEEAVISDSDSSAASIESGAGDHREDQPVTESCVSLFPFFSWSP